MAIYNLISSIPSAQSLKSGDILNCDYSGTYKKVILPAGNYKLECWGAQGGYRSSSTYGGKGGYSVGVITLSSLTTVYLYVGGSGNTGGVNGGFNGGGFRISYNGGGGASDVRIGNSSLYARVIVAGGGGSDGAVSKTGMYGGGTSGGTATQSFGSGGGGGTQTAGGVGSGNNNTGTFGQGGKGWSYSSGYAGAGGGGWYGGGGSYPDSSGDDDRGGGGGSGYVYTSSTASNYPSGCLLNSSYYLTDAQTIAGNTSFTSPSGGTETGHSGNGYIRITVNKLPSEITEIYIKTKTPIQSLLPSGYTALEYIESVGAQYIDTGLIVNKTDSYEMILIAHLINNDNFAGANGYLQFQAKIGNNKKSKIDIKYINKIETIFVDNQQVSSTDWSTSYNGTNVKLGIFKLGDANNTWYSQTGQSGKLYSCKILNNNNLIRNFIPCKNTSGIAGLWDTINKQFYVSASIADFTAGPVTTTATTSWVKIGSL